MELFVLGKSRLKETKLFNWPMLPCLNVLQPYNATAQSGLRMQASS